MTKRILLITDIFPPDIGGPATFIPALARSLSAKGHRVTVICRSDFPEHAFDRNFPAKVVRISRHGNRATHELLTYAAIAKEALRHSVIFCNGLEPYVATVCRLLRRKYILKVVGDVAWEAARFHGDTVMDLDDFQKHSQITSPQQRVRNWREDFVRRAHRIVTPSHYMRDLVSGWGVPLSRISVISNGVTEESFSKVIPKRDPQAPLSVAFVGRLTNWKGVDGLLLAVHQLDGVRLTIMGDGHAYPLLKDLARRLQLHDKVTFKGRLNQSEIRQAMAESHLLVLPSLYEGLSHTLLEAGAQGLPCIASHMGGNREVIVDGMHGDLVDPFDVSALVEKIRRYRDDESLRLARAEAFQKRIREDFFLPRAIPKYETLLFPEAQN